MKFSFLEPYKGEKTLWRPKDHNAVADLGEASPLILGKKEEMAEGRKEQVNHNRPAPHPPAQGQNPPLEKLPFLVSF